MNRLQKILFSVCALLLISGSAAMAQDVLVWATGNGGGDTQGVADYLMGTGFFTSTTATNDPFVDLATLSGYDAVLFFTNGIAGDMVAIGDVLADYADTGAQLVLAVFSWADQGGNTLAGRIITDQISPYWLEGGSLYTNVTMTWNDGSPLFDMVNTVDGFYHDNVMLTTDAVENATWSDGEPLVATKGNVVGVNLFPDDFYGNIGGDYVYLFANALSSDVVATENATWSQLKATYLGR